MINLYIFDKYCRAKSYGLGTYIKELTTALKGKDMNVCIIHLQSYNENNEKEKQIHLNKKKDVTDSDDIRHLYISIPVTPDRSIDNHEQDELYYSEVVSQLKLYINNHERLIFHLNLLDYQNFVNQLRNTFDCLIVSTIHSINWGFFFFDNLPRLRQIINETDPDQFEERMRKSFEEEKSLFMSVDHIICISNYMHELLCREYGVDSQKTSFIPNGLSEIRTSSADKQQFREKWKVNYNEKIIFFAGRMDPIKGLNFLIKAFRMVLSTFPQCRLVIAGEGDFSSFTKQSQDICTRITFTGFLDKELLYEWYKIADIGVIPSLFEPFGYVAAEMMMQELPLIVTATSGLNEVIDESCGLKVPIIVNAKNVEISPELLAEKILYLLQHPVEAKQLGKNGRKRYLNEYSSEVFSRNMRQFYKSLYS